MESDSNVSPTIRTRAHLTFSLSLEACVYLPGCIRCQPPEPCWAGCRGQGSKGFHKQGLWV